MVDIQREIASSRNVVMDGRDIGTHVLPNADLKIYLTADAKERARRRYEELRAKGADDSYEDVFRKLVERDREDSMREVSPLRKADDALKIDSTGMTLDEVTELVLRVARERMGGDVL